MIDFKTISGVFQKFIDEPGSEAVYDDALHRLVHESIKSNKTLWDLEDTARRSEMGDSHVAEAKRNIDANNHIRNNLMKKIDAEIFERLKIQAGPLETFYSESPGMILDRLSIIFLKLAEIQRLLTLIKEDDLRSDYKEKERIILGQIESIGRFFDLYFKKLASGEAFFAVQEPVKIYNDLRVRKYLTE
jgi:hypothetical protein